MNGALASAVAGDALTLARLDRPARAACDEYVRAHPQASLYHLGSWADVIADVFGHECHSLYASDAHGVRGVLPLIRLRSRLFGDYLVSMPYFNYGGALADDAIIAERLMQSAAAHAQTLGSTHIEFRDSVPRAAAWPVRTDKISMELALPDTGDALWKAMEPKLRAQIKRSGKEGATTVVGGAELLDDFYRVFARNMRDLGTPVYPKRFFARIAQAFPQNSFIVVVRYQAQPVAAGFLLGFNDKLEIPWASAVRDFNRLGVNMALYWEVLQQAIARGYKTFDFGRCSRDSGTYRFKKQWGAIERPLYWHYWLPAGAPMPGLTPHNPKYALAIRLWQRLPIAVANRLGPYIVKNLP